MTRTQAIDKVRKLRALAAGAGVRAEAETAWGKAFDLAKAHGLTEADLVGDKPKVPWGPQVVPIYESLWAQPGVADAVSQVLDGLKDALLHELGVPDTMARVAARNRRRRCA